MRSLGLQIMVSSIFYYYYLNFKHKLIVYKEVNRLFYVIHDILIKWHQ